MKYGLASCAIAAFIALLWLASGSPLATTLLFLAWEIAGLWWLVRYSYVAKLWRYRRRGGPLRSIMQVLIVPVYVLPWPLWLAVGEDIFD